MSRYGIVESGFWQNPKSRRLTDTEALMLVYLFSSPHANSVGCYVLPAGYITADRPQWGAETVSDTLSKLSRYGFIERDESSGLTRIVGWFGHNSPQNPKVMASMLKVIDALPASPVTAKLIDAMLESGNEHVRKRRGDLEARRDTISKRFRNGIDTVSREEPPNLTDPEPEPEPYPNQNQPSAAGAAAASPPKKDSSPPKSSRQPSLPKPPLLAVGDALVRRIATGFETKLGNVVTFEELFFDMLDGLEARGLARSLACKLLKLSSPAAAYDTLAMAKGKEKPQSYVATIVRRIERDQKHEDAAVRKNGAALPGDPEIVPEWVRDVRRSGEIATWNSEHKYWDWDGGGYDNDQNQVSG